jgi:hypothetical protein
VSNADADRPHHFVPAWRPRQVASGFRTQAARRVCAASEDVLRCKVVAGEFELERARESRAVVVLGQPAEWKQRIGVSERPAPTIEADNALRLGDRFASDRLAVESRLAEPLESLPATSLHPHAGHEIKDTTVKEKIPSCWDCLIGRLPLESVQ